MSEIKTTNKLYEISGKLEELNNLLENLDGINIPAELAEIYITALPGRNISDLRSQS